jgi:hypothetical protein
MQNDGATIAAATLRRVFLRVKKPVTAASF